MNSRSSKHNRFHPERLSTPSTQSTQRLQRLFKSICVFVILSCFLSITHTCAQLSDRIIDLDGKYLGTTVVPFLAFPVGARGAALGQASIALTEDATSSFWNPAALGLLRRHEFSFSHSEMFMGVRNEYLTVALPRDYLGTFAFRAQMFTAGTFRNSRDENEQPSDPGLIDFLAGASYGGAFIPEKFYAGFGLNFFQSRIDGEQASGICGDAFTQVMPGKGLRFALGVKNIGHKVKYYETGEDIPFGIVVGIGQGMLKKGQLKWGIGASKYMGDLPEAGMGMEYNFANRMTLRAGYSTALDSLRFDGIKGLTLGTGFREKRYVFDYAWAGGLSELGSTHYLTVAARFKELTPKTAEDYYKIALKHFRKGKYKRCIEEAENALRVNPNLWKAHALIARAYGMMRKAAGVEIALIYTGNTNGVIVAEQRGNAVIGGMARRATAVKSLAGINPYHLILDAGNLFTAKSQEIKIQILLDAMSRMGYSLLGIGIGEIANGLDKVGIPANKLGLKYLATNISGIKKFPSFVEDRVITIQGKYDVYVACVLGDQYQSLIANEGLQMQPVMEALSRRLQKKGDKANLRVVIVNDDDAAVRHLAQQLPEVDVMICGISNKIYAKPLVIGKTLILSSGRDGRYVGVLTVQFNNKKEMLSYQHRLIRLSQEVKEDPEIAEIMNHMLIRAELEKTGEDLDFARGNTRGIFLYVSDRTGTKNIYLKFVKSNMDFRLTDGPESHYEPVFCPISGKVAFLNEWKDSATSKIYLDLWTMELAGVKKKRVTLKEHVLSPVWHPSGNALYFCSDSTGDYEIYRTGPEGQFRTNITNILQSSSSNESGLAFSALGKDLVFVTDRDGKDQIYLTYKDGKNPLRLTEDNANHAEPAFSPDGKYLAYLSDKFGFGGQKDLVVLNLETNDHKFLTQNTNVRSFVWCCNAEKIIFEAGVNITDLNIVRVSDGYMEKLLPSEAIKRCSEQLPTKFWYKGEEWILYQEADKTQTVINRVKVDGSEDQPCVVEDKNNWLR